MPIPIVLGALAVGAGALGIKKGVDSYRDDKKADNFNRRACASRASAVRRLESVREQTEESLCRLGELKLKCLDDQMERFVALFERFKRVEISREIQRDALGAVSIEDEQLQDMKEDSLMASKLLTGGAASVGSGALAGVAAYGGTSTLATASTGTAINTLSGAAAKNATLAWLGGGARAVGGMGMVGGKLVLGSIVIGPALAVGGLIAAARSREKLAEARKNWSNAKVKVAEMRKEREKLKGIDDAIVEVTDVIEQIRERLDRSLDEMVALIDGFGDDYGDIPQSDRRKIHRTVELARLLKELLDASLLTEEGTLVSNHRELVTDARRKLTDR